MICANNKTNVLYNYSFINDNELRLENSNEKFIINYEKWLNEYYIKDKFSKLKKHQK